MGDYIWYIIVAALFFVLGIVFIVMGLQILIKQKMNLIISHHCEKVKEENKQAYCKLFGIGVFIIGIGFLLSCVCIPLIKTFISFIPLAAGLIVGIVLIVSAIVKYNR